MRSSSNTLAAALALVAAVAGATGGDRITVAADVTVAADTIRLRDLAALEGPAAVDVADLSLGPAPIAGETRTLDGARVLDALRRAGVDVATVTYSIPASIRVRRAAQDLSEATVRAAIETYLGEALGAGAGDAVVRSVELPGIVRVPAGAVAVHVMPAANRRLLGRVRLELEVAVDGRPVKTVWVTADLGVYGPVVVATRAVGRGETIVAGDVAVERRDLADVGRGAVGDAGAAIGRVARAPLVPYTPVRSEQIETPPEVHRGDVVLLVAERGGMRITAPGEVRDDAGRGEQVHVVNRTSRKDLIGRVIDANTVVVDF